MDIDHIFNHLHIEGKRAHEEAFPHETTFLRSIGYEYVGMLGYGSEAITIRVRNDSGTEYAAKVIFGSLAEERKYAAIADNVQLRQFILHPMEIHHYKEHSTLEQIIGDVWDDIVKHDDMIVSYYPPAHRNDMKGYIMIFRLMEGSMEIEDGRGLLIFKNDLYRAQFADWIEQAWDAAYENNFVHGDLHLRNILFERVTKHHAEFLMTDISSAKYPAPDTDATRNIIDAEFRDLKEELPSDYLVSIAPMPHDNACIPYSSDDENSDE